MNIHHKKAGEAILITDEASFRKKIIMDNGNNILPLNQFLKKLKLCFNFK